MKKTIRRADLHWKRVSLVKDVEQQVYGESVSCSHDAINIARALLDHEVHEVFIALFLNNKNRVIGYQEIARGGMNAAAVKTGDVFRGALIAVARCIIIAHNHPSGVATPSAEDIKFTKRLRRAGELLGVQVLDHIIVGENETISFLDARLFNDD